MEEMERQTELDQTYIDFLNALEDFTENEFDDLWDKDVQSSKYITLEYNDAYAIEEIWFEVIKTYNPPNQDKPTAYIELDIEVVIKENEYFSASALAQDEMIPGEAEDLTEDQYWEWIQTQEIEDDKQREAWKTKPTINAGVLNETIELSPGIYHETCYNNITHTHHYPSIKIKTRLYTTIKLEKIKALLAIRDLIYGLTWNALDR